jgi:hypothetical protein
MKAHREVEALEAAIARRDKFLSRLEQADPTDWLPMIAEAIGMHLEANSLETVGRDMRVRVTLQSICASHCLKAIRDKWEAVNGRR